MSDINEWTFAADVCKWIGEILVTNPGLPFSEAKVEQPSGPSRKRRDLTLYDRTGEPVLTGEIKLPDRPDGQSPYSHALLEDAFDKANQKGVAYFFTWNVNRFVLWQTFEARKAVPDRDLEHFNVTSISSREHLSDPRVQAEIKGVLTTILGRFARILEGTEPIRSRPLDEKFVGVLESALEIPILQTQAAIRHRYSADKRFARNLDAWMRDSQGWLISTEPQLFEDNVRRAAHFSCYVLANKIVFRQALQKRFPTLRKIKFPESIKEAGKVREILTAAFKEAKYVTRDYDTVFDGDFGDTLPFLESTTVPSWRGFLRQIEGFDFGKIEYDIIGQIFERLISPAERQRYGQYYTRPEVVDLINAFSIREPHSVVLDPACGGGTFLVRAYVLKRELSGRTLAHSDLIEQIKGIDISAWATHLTTINLATRDLIDEKNYPLVARSDFFQVGKDKAVFFVPMSVHGKGKQMVSLAIGSVDAVVGNPPYVRQEEIRPAEYKERIRQLVREDFPDVRLSGRSDLHCYFWPHATSFLKEGGYYGFLTSSAWLDAEYGFHLQEWLLQHFAILALFESNCEPWFIGARVTTVATLMQRESDPAKRASNTVRFVQLRKPLKEVLGSFDSDPLKAARKLRDFIENCDENWADDRWRISVVNQHELWKVGCTGGVARQAKEAENAWDASILFRGNYVGGKWGIYLRAPDIFFKILDRCGSQLVPLGQLAEIRFGVKSGADDFFFVRDVTDEEVAKAGMGHLKGSSEIARIFKVNWGIGLADTRRVRVVQSGDGSRHLIEAEYLEPEVHSLMEIDSVEIDPAKLARNILLVSDPPEKLRGTHVLKYIKWGEKEGFDQGATCSARAKTRPWYDLTQAPRASLLWQKTHKYRHVSPLNPTLLIANCRMYTIAYRFGTEKAFAAVLNSTLVALTKSLYGRFYGTEGTLDTEIVDCNLMIVPDLRGVSTSLLDKLEAWIESHKGDPVGHLKQELRLQKRRELDLLVLEVLRFQNEAEREQFVNDLHNTMAVLHTEFREIELKANINKRISARQGRASPRTIAEEIWKEFEKAQIRNFPADFLRDGEPAETISLPAGKPKVLGLLGAVQVNGSVIHVGSPARAEFAAKAVEHGNYGPTAVPQSDSACRQALQHYRSYEAQMEASFKELAEERTADPETRSRIVRELWKLLFAASRQTQDEVE